MTEKQLREFSLSLPMALLQARESVMQRFRPLLKEHNITEQQWRVIRVLSESDGYEPTDLADKTFLLLPSLTRIIRSMEEKGWVKKSTVAGDHRRRLVQITSAGQRLFNTVSPRSEAIYKSIESELDVEKLKTLYALLEEISNLSDQTSMTATVQPTAKIGIGS